MRSRNPTTIRLRPKTDRVIKRLQDKLGLSQTAIIDMAVIKLGEIEGIVDNDNEAQPEVKN